MSFPSQSAPKLLFCLGHKKCSGLVVNLSDCRQADLAQNFSSVRISSHEHGKHPANRTVIIVLIHSLSLCSTLTPSANVSPPPCLPTLEISSRPPLYFVLAVLAHAVLLKCPHQTVSLSKARSLVCSGPAMAPVMKELRKCL